MRTVISAATDPSGQDLGARASRRVDFGVTSYFFKTRFGARGAAMNVYYRAANPILGLLLRSLSSRKGYGL